MKNKFKIENDFLGFESGLTEKENSSISCQSINLEEGHTALSNVGLIKQNIIPNHKFNLFPNVRLTNDMNLKNYQNQECIKNTSLTVSSTIKNCHSLHNKVETSLYNNNNADKLHEDFLFTHCAHCLSSFKTKRQLNKHKCKKKIVVEGDDLKHSKCSVNLEHLPKTIIDFCSSGSNDNMPVNKISLESTKQQDYSLNDSKNLFGKHESNLLLDCSNLFAEFDSYDKLSDNSFTGFETFSTLNMRAFPNKDFDQNLNPECETFDSWNESLLNKSHLSNQEMKLELRSKCEILDSSKVEETKFLIEQYATGSSEFLKPAEVGAVDAHDSILYTTEVSKNKEIKKIAIRPINVKKFRAKKCEGRGKTFSLSNLVLKTDKEIESTKLSIDNSSVSCLKTCAVSNKICNQNLKFNNHTLENKFVPTQQGAVGSCELLRKDKVVSVNSTDYYMLDITQVLKNKERTRNARKQYKNIGFQKNKTKKYINKKNLSRSTLVLKSPEKGQSILLPMDYSNTSNLNASSVPNHETKPIQYLKSKYKVGTNTFNQEIKFIPPERYLSESCELFEKEGVVTENRDESNIGMENISKIKENTKNATNQLHLLEFHKSQINMNITSRKSIHKPNLELKIANESKSSKNNQQPIDASNESSLNACTFPNQKIDNSKSMREILNPLNHNSEVISSEHCSFENCELFKNEVVVALNAGTEVSEGNTRRRKIDYAEVTKSKENTKKSKKQLQKCGFQKSKTKIKVVGKKSLPLCNQKLKIDEDCKSSQLVIDNVNESSLNACALPNQELNSYFKSKNETFGTLNQKRELTQPKESSIESCELFKKEGVMTVNTNDSIIDMEVSKSNAKINVICRNSCFKSDLEQKIFTDIKSSNQLPIENSNKSSLNSCALPNQETNCCLKSKTNILGTFKQKNELIPSKESSIESCELFEMLRGVTVKTNDRPNNNELNVSKNKENTKNVKKPFQKFGFVKSKAKINDKPIIRNSGSKSNLELIIDEESKGNKLLIDYSNKSSLNACALPSQEINCYLKPKNDIFGTLNQKSCDLFEMSKVANVATNNSKIDITEVSKNKENNKDMKKLCKKLSYQIFRTKNVSRKNIDVTKSSRLSMDNSNKSYLNHEINNFLKPKPNKKIFDTLNQECKFIPAGKCGTKSCELLNSKVAVTVCKDTTSITDINKVSKSKKNMKRKNIHDKKLDLGTIKNEIGLNVRNENLSIPNLVLEIDGDCKNRLPDKEELFNKTSITNALKIDLPSTKAAFPLENYFKCHQCSFTCTRLNVIIWHNRAHRKNVPDFDSRYIFNNRVQQNLSSLKEGNEPLIPTLDNSSTNENSSKGSFKKVSSAHNNSKKIKIYEKQETKILESGSKEEECINGKSGIRQKSIHIQSDINSVFDDFLSDLSNRHFSANDVDQTSDNESVCSDWEKYFDNSLPDIENDPYLEIASKEIHEDLHFSNIKLRYNYKDFKIESDDCNAISSNKENKLNYGFENAKKLALYNGSRKKSHVTQFLNKNKFDQCKLNIKELKCLYCDFTSNSINIFSSHCESHFSKGKVMDYKSSLINPPHIKMISISQQRKNTKRKDNFQILDRNLTKKKFYKVKNLMKNKTNKKIKFPFVGSELNFERNQNEHLNIDHVDKGNNAIDGKYPNYPLKRETNLLANEICDTNQAVSVKIHTDRDESSVNEGSNCDKYFFINSEDQNNIPSKIKYQIGLSPSRIWKINNSIAVTSTPKVKKSVSHIKSKIFGIPKFKVDEADNVLSTVQDVTSKGKHLNTINDFEIKSLDDVEHSPCKNVGSHSVKSPVDITVQKIPNNGPVSMFEGPRLKKQKPNVVCKENSCALNESHIPLKKLKLENLKQVKPMTENKRKPKLLAADIYRCKQCEFSCERYRIFVSHCKKHMIDVIYIPEHGKILKGRKSKSESAIREGKKFKKQAKVEQLTSKGKILSNSYSKLGSNLFKSKEMIGKLSNAAKILKSSKKKPLEISKLHSALHENSPDFEILLSESPTLHLYDSAMAFTSNNINSCKISNTKQNTNKASKVENDKNNYTSPDKDSYSVSKYTFVEENENIEPKFPSMKSKSQERSKSVPCEVEEKVSLNNSIITLSANQSLNVSCPVMSTPCTLIDANKEHTDICDDTFSECGDCEKYYNPDNNSVTTICEKHNKRKDLVCKIDTGRNKNSIASISKKSDNFSKAEDIIKVVESFPYTSFTPANKNVFDMDATTLTGLSNKSKMQETHEILTDCSNRDKYLVSKINAVKSVCEILGDVRNAADGLETDDDEICLVDVESISKNSNLCGLAEVIVQKLNSSLNNSGRMSKIKNLCDSSLEKLPQHYENKTSCEKLLQIDITHDNMETDDDKNSCVDMETTSEKLHLSREAKDIVVQSLEITSTKQNLFDSSLKVSLPGHSNNGSCEKLLKVGITMDSKEIDDENCIVDVDNISCKAKDIIVQKVEASHEKLNSFKITPINQNLCYSQLEISPTCHSNNDNSCERLLPITISVDNMVTDDGENSIGDVEIISEKLDLCTEAKEIVQRVDSIHEPFDSLETTSIRQDVCRSPLEVSSPCRSNNDTSCKRLLPIANAVDNMVTGDDENSIVDVESISEKFDLRTEAKDIVQRVDSFRESFDTLETTSIRQDVCRSPLEVSSPCHSNNDTSGKRLLPITNAVDNMVTDDEENSIVDVESISEKFDLCTNAKEIVQRVDSIHEPFDSLETTSIRQDVCRSPLEVSSPCRSNNDTSCKRLLPITNAVDNMVTDDEENSIVDVESISEKFDLCTKAKDVVERVDSFHEPFDSLETTSIRQDVCRAPLEVSLPCHSNNGTSCERLIKITNAVDNMVTDDDEDSTVDVESISEKFDLCTKAKDVVERVDSFHESFDCLETTLMQNECRSPPVVSSPCHSNNGTSCGRLLAIANTVNNMETEGDEKCIVDVENISEKLNLDLCCDTKDIIVQSLETFHESFDSLETTSLRQNVWGSPLEVLSPCHSNNGTCKKLLPITNNVDNMETDDDENSIVDVESISDKFILCSEAKDIIFQRVVPFDSLETTLRQNVGCSPLEVLSPCHSNNGTSCKTSLPIINTVENMETDDDENSIVDVENISEKLDLSGEVEYIQRPKSFPDSLNSSREIQHFYNSLHEESSSLSHNVTSQNLLKIPNTVENVETDNNENCIANGKYISEKSDLFVESKNIVQRVESFHDSINSSGNTSKKQNLPECSLEMSPPPSKNGTKQLLYESSGKIDSAIKNDNFSVDTKFTLQKSHIVNNNAEDLSNIVETNLNAINSGSTLTNVSAHLKLFYFNPECDISSNVNVGKSDVSSQVVEEANLIGLGDSDISKTNLSVNLKMFRPIIENKPVFTSQHHYNQLPKLPQLLQPQSLADNRSVSIKDLTDCKSKDIKKGPEDYVCKSNEFIVNKSTKESIDDYVVNFNLNCMGKLPSKLSSMSATDKFVNEGKTPSHASTVKECTLNISASQTIVSTTSYIDENSLPLLAFGHSTANKCSLPGGKAEKSYSKGENNKSFKNTIILTDDITNSNEYTGVKDTSETGKISSTFVDKKHEQVEDSISLIHFDHETKNPVSTYSKHEKAGCDSMATKEDTCQGINDQHLKMSCVIKGHQHNLRDGDFVSKEFIRNNKRSIIKEAPELEKLKDGDTFSEQVKVSSRKEDKIESKATNLFVQGSKNDSKSISYSNSEVENVEKQVSISPQTSPESLNETYPKESLSSSSQAKGSLVAIDEKGDIVAVPILNDGDNQLYAVEVSMEDGTSRILYVDPAHLSNDVDITKLVIQIDNSGQETVIIPTSSPGGDIVFSINNLVRVQ